MAEAIKEAIRNDDVDAYLALKAQGRAPDMVWDARYTQYDRVFRSYSHLGYALKWRSKSIAAVLMDPAAWVARHVDFDARTLGFYTPLGLAIDAQDVDMVRFVLKQENVDPSVCLKQTSFAEGEKGQDLFFGAENVARASGSNRTRVDAGVKRSIERMIKRGVN